MELLLHVDFKSSAPLYRQLYDGLRKGILSGRFAAGSRLPGSRALADSLRISRITVTECYDTLISEGYLETRSRSGTFVCRKLPELTLHAPSVAANNHRPSSTISPRLSRYGVAVNKPRSTPDPPGTIRLNLHGPDLSRFPRKIWGRLVARRLQEGHGESFDYTNAFAGNLDLRKLIAGYLSRSRAVVCDPEQIVVVNGSQQAIYLAARILLNEGDSVALESPGYRLAGEVFSSQGAILRPVCVDQNGIRVADLRKHRENKLRLVYLTPSHQFPTGVSLSMPRRMELLTWARDNRILILEDDYDSEFRYNTRPLPSLQGMLPDSPVLYVGTFSKLLLPTLRIGYLVVPHSLRDAFVSAKVFSDIQSSSLDQQILADFLTEGHLEPYVRRMRTIYGKRRALFVRSLRRYFGSRIKILGDDAGMHFMAEFRTSLSDDKAYQLAFEAGVRVERVYWPSHNSPTRSGHVAFVLAFAGRSDAELCLAAERLAGAFL